MKASDTLFSLLEARLPAPAMAWLAKSREKVAARERARDLFMVFSAVPRYVPRQQVELRATETADLKKQQPGLDLSHWTLDQLARIGLLLELSESESLFTDTLHALFDTADMGEQIALYKGFALFPFPEKLRRQAAEGIRTNMTSVFDAIALDNPYPAEYLEEEAWNQMVLKAAFMDRPLYRIQGLDKRSNPRLARIISDYAHERWAAGRVVSPELWRAAGQSWSETLASDMQKLFADEDPLQRQAAALLCRQADHPDARSLLDQHTPDEPKLQELAWDTLSRQWWDRQDSNP